jgi:adenylate kinase
MKIVILGALGSGKGTQADMLSKKFNIPHISTGQIFRDIQNDKDNPLAQEVTEYMNKGALVPDEVVGRLVAERIKQDDCQNGYILDGYTRKLSQAETLSKIDDIDTALSINISDEEVIKRTSGRRSCKNGHIWHVDFNPSKDDKVCDTCSEELFQREDDNEEAIKKRLDIYHQESDPIIDFYEESGKLIKIDGEQTIEKVFEDILKSLNEQN